MSELKTVKLYGHLGKKFGKTFQLAVSTPAEAIRALSINLVGFKDYLKAHSNPGFHIFLDKKDIGHEEVGMLCSSDIIKIIPVTIGSGGFFKIAIGVFMMYMGDWSTSSSWFTVGASMVLSGASEILFAPPRNKGGAQTEKPENTPSYVFNGPINTTGQGNAVSLCYGRVRVGSQVISAGLTSREIPI